MPKLTLSGLRKLRVDKKEQIKLRDTEGNHIQVIVGMGTCGIAAGAKETYEAIRKAAAEKGIDNIVVLRQTGCMGLCYVEPTVEVAMSGMPTVIYGKVDAAGAREIVEKHILEKILLDDHIYDKPAIDIIER